VIESILDALSYAVNVEYIVVRVAMLICDTIGIIILMATVFKSAYHYFHKEKHVKLMLAQGIALALEFKLAAEVLRTITVREVSELIVLGSIILLRGAITVLIHWEIKTEKAEIALEVQEEAQAAMQAIKEGAVNEHEHKL